MPALAPDVFVGLLSVSSSFVPAKRVSSPVGCSGGKNRCGRSHDPSSSLIDFLPGLEGEGLVGVQSIASSSGKSSVLVEGAEAVDNSEGMPNMGFEDCETTGLEERLSAVRSGSVCVGNTGTEDERVVVVVALECSGVAREEWG